MINHSDIVKQGTRLGLENALERLIRRADQLLEGELPPLSDANSTTVDTVPDYRVSFGSMQTEFALLLRQTQQAMSDETLTPEQGDTLLERIVLKGTEYSVQMRLRHEAMQRAKSALSSDRSEGAASQSETSPVTDFLSLIDRLTDSRETLYTGGELAAIGIEASTILQGLSDGTITQRGKNSDGSALYVVNKDILERAPRTIRSSFSQGGFTVYYSESIPVEGKEILPNDYPVPEIREEKRNEDLEAVTRVNFKMYTTGTLVARDDITLTPIRARALLREMADKGLAKRYTETQGGLTPDSPTQVDVYILPDASIEYVKARSKGLKPKQLLKDESQIDSEILTRAMQQTAALKYVHVITSNQLREVLGLSDEMTKRVFRYIRTNTTPELEHSDGKILSCLVYQPVVDTINRALTETKKADADKILLAQLYQTINEDLPEQLPVLEKDQDTMFLVVDGKEVEKRPDGPAAKPPKTEKLKDAIEGIDVAPSNLSVSCNYYTAYSLEQVLKEKGVKISRKRVKEMFTDSDNKLAVYGYSIAHRSDGERKVHVFLVPDASIDYVVARDSSKKDQQLSQTAFTELEARKNADYEKIKNLRIMTFAELRAHLSKDMNMTDYSFDRFFPKLYSLLEKGIDYNGEHSMVGFLVQQKLVDVINKCLTFLGRSPTEKFEKLYDLANKPEFSPVGENSGHQPKRGKQDGKHTTGSEIREEDTYGYTLYDLTSLETALKTNTRNLICNRSLISSTLIDMARKGLARAYDVSPTEEAKHCVYALSDDGFEYLSQLFKGRKSKGKLMIVDDPELIRKTREETDAISIKVISTKRLAELLDYNTDNKKVTYRKNMRKFRDCLVEGKTVAGTNYIITDDLAAKLNSAFSRDDITTSMLEQYAAKEISKISNEPAPHGEPPKTGGSANGGDRAKDDKNEDNKSAYQEPQPTSARKRIDPPANYTVQTVGQWISRLRVADEVTIDASAFKNYLAILPAKKVIRFTSDFGNISHETVAVIPDAGYDLVLWNMRKDKQRSTGFLAAAQSQLELLTDLTLLSKDQLKQAITDRNSVIGRKDIDDEKLDQSIRSLLTKQYQGYQLRNNIDYVKSAEVNFVINYRLIWAVYEEFGLNIPVSTLYEHSGRSAPSSLHPYFAGEHDQPSLNPLNLTVQTGLELVLDSKKGDASPSPNDGNTGLASDPSLKAAYPRTADVWYRITKTDAVEEGVFGTEDWQTGFRREKIKNIKPNGSPTSGSVKSGIREYLVSGDYMDVLNIDITDQMLTTEQK